jgi:hypothetical protein
MWKGVDLSTLSGQSLRNAVSQIFSDSIAASSSGESYGETLREVRRRDRTGHADRPHPALGQDLTPSPTRGRRLADGLDEPVYARQAVSEVCFGSAA